MKKIPENQGVTEARERKNLTTNELRRAK